MTTITRTTTHTIDIEHNGKEYELELPYADPHGDYWIIDSARLTVHDGHLHLTYIVSDDDGGSCYDEEELFQGWDHVILRNQRDADDLHESLHVCDECGQEFDHDDDEMWIRHDFFGNPMEIDLHGNPIMEERHEFVPSERRKALDAGTAFFIEKYEHGMVRYALQGESSAVDRAWDVTGVAGFMMSDGEWGTTKSIADYARGTLESFTDWCNGNIFGIVHARYTLDGDLVDDEAVWGFLGEEHALASLPDHFGDVRD